MSKQLFDYTTLLKISRERHIRSWMWFLDVDGTLLDLAPSPGDVKVPPTLTASLRQIGADSRQRLALVSGRSLTALTELFPSMTLSQSGNHGAEFCDPPETWLHPTAQRFARQHALLQLLLQPLALDFPGLLLEDKTYSFSVHYRNVPVREHEALAQTLSQLLISVDNVQILPAKLCWEVRPDPGPNKGQAVQTLFERWQDSMLTPSLPIIIGDDRTDEDAFDALRESISIHVGEGPTHALYHMENPAAVRRFLSLFSENLKLLQES